MSEYKKIRKMIYGGAEGADRLIGVTRASKWFRKTYEFLEHKIEEENPSLKSTDLLQLILPSIVILAFSCELELKAIIRHETGKAAKGHELKELFSQLELKTQEAIKNYVIENCVVGDYCDSIDANGKLDFEKTLSSNSNTFIDWRYYFEKFNTADVQFLKCFGDILSKLVNEIEVD